MDLLLHLLLILFTAVAAAQQDDEYTSLHGCPSSCGDVTVPYPFGFTPNCHRPGFQLNCITSDNTTSLFIGTGTGPDAMKVTFISTKTITVNLSSSASVADSVNVYRNASWTANLAGTPYTLATTSNNLTAVGCNIVASLINIDTGVTLAACASTCDSHVVNDTFSCSSGHGCCSTAIPESLRSYAVRIDPLVSKSTLGTDAAAALMEGTDLSILSRTEGVEVALDWAIRDYPTCAIARNTSSYACGNNTLCVDMEGGSKGYYCECTSSVDDGNPYIRDSCQESRSLTKPVPGCPKKCGTIDVPFPFGIGRGCYRNDKFSLDCSKNGTLTWVENTQVSTISVEQGVVKLQANDVFPDDFIFHDSNATIAVGWVAGFESCDEAKNISYYACVSNNSECLGKSHGNGYNCKCSQGYQGNPYLHGGCKDIDECRQLQRYTCSGTCMNLLGSYSCTSRPLSIRDKRSIVVLGVYIGISIGVGLLLLSLMVALLYKRWKRITTEKNKETNFRKNQGLLLKQAIESNEAAAERTKIFPMEELKKATNNFDPSRILGTGGHGTVYKGILSDKRVVAIKKSKIVVQIEIEQFINEVFMLSLVNHRNVVKLFGCCLETEVPLLVYEFISNGSLYDHLHLAAHRSSLSWDDRLRIAAETAGALTYLHSSASISIYHRDLKTSNILLDDNLSVKVSDFGSSRSIPLDQSHVVTLIQGTFGYLDPEYFQTMKLTEKSDVYSFGVILVELLTGEMPFSKSEVEASICTYFISSLREKRLFEIVESRVMKEVITEAITEELDTVAQLAEICLKIKGEERPTMKEVEATLDALIRAKKQKQHPRFPKKHKESESLQGQQSDTLIQGTFGYLDPEYSQVSNTSSILSFEKTSNLELTLPR